jgi:hypothetical protein
MRERDLPNLLLIYFLGSNRPSFVFWLDPYDLKPHGISIPGADGRGRNQLNIHEVPGAEWSFDMHAAACFAYVFCLAALHELPAIFVDSGNFNGETQEESLPPAAFVS